MSSPYQRFAPFSSQATCLGTSVPGYLSTRVPEYPVPKGTHPRPTISIPRHGSLPKRRAWKTPRNYHQATCISYLNLYHSATLHIQTQGSSTTTMIIGAEAGPHQLKQHKVEGYKSCNKTPPPRRSRECVLKFQKISDTKSEDLQHKF